MGLLPTTRPLTLEAHSWTPSHLLLECTQIHNNHTYACNRNTNVENHRDSTNTNTEQSHLGAYHKYKYTKAKHPNTPNKNTQQTHIYTQKKHKYRKQNTQTQQTQIHRKHINAQCTYHKHKYSKAKHTHLPNKNTQKTHIFTHHKHKYTGNTHMHDPKTQLHNNHIETNTQIHADMKVHSRN